MCSGGLQEEDKWSKVLPWDGRFPRLVASLTGDDNVRMVGAPDVGAQNVAAVWVGAMKEVYPLEVCDHSIEGDLAQLLAPLMAIS